MNKYCDHKAFVFAITPSKHFLKSICMIKSHQQQVKFSQKSDTRFSNMLTFLHPVTPLCSQQKIKSIMKVLTNECEREKDPFPQKTPSKQTKTPHRCQGGGER